MTGSPRNSMTGDPPRPLAGRRVLEVGVAWSGPFVGRFLGALGADVVKVESPTAPDLWRRPYIRPDGPARGASDHESAPNFNALNRNKRSLSLDLSRPSGPSLLMRLAAAADVVIVNLSAKVLPRYGVDVVELVRCHPSLVVLVMPALGMSGPYAAAVGYGSIIEGLGGMAARFGYRHERARVSQTFYPDPVAGIHATLAVLAALRQRATSGRGGVIDLSQQETLWLQLGEGVALRSREGRDPDRLGSAEPHRSPSGVYPTKDGRWIAIVVRDEPQYGALVAVAGGALETVGAWPLGERLIRRDDVDEHVARWSMTQEADRLVATLRPHGIGVHPVETYSSVSASGLGYGLDLFEELDHHATGVVRYLRLPVRTDGQPWASVGPAPAFGSDTRDVAREWLGLPEEELAVLEAEGAIGQDLPSPR